MKKFLLGVIFIIPIIVMVAISAAATIIATATSPLPAEIHLFDDSGVLLLDGDIIELELTDTTRYLTAEILPMLVKDDSIDFEMDTESGDGRLHLLRQENSDRYTIVPEAPGAVSATIRASANISIVRILTFVINTQEISGIDIFDENGEYPEEISLLKQERVYAEISPVVALAGYNLNWKSSDESIVKVSANGTLYPVSRGKAYVSLSALDKLGNIHTDSILVDTSLALVTSDTVYTSGEITLGWIEANLLLGESTKLNKDVYTNYYVSGEGNTVNLKFIFCAQGEWGFCDGLDVIYTRHTPYFAEVCVLDTNEPLNGVELISGDPTVCGVDGMALVPKKSGTVTISAVYGGQVKTKTITVRDNPAVLSLNLSSADAKRGIKMTRLWGVYTYAGGELINEYQMRTIENADVIWKTDDTTKATVDQNGLVTFNEASRGRKVVVTASTMVYGKATGVSRSFTFNILNSDAVNVYTYDDLSAVNAMKKYVSVLQSDMESPYEITLCNSVYGNGFTVSAEVRKVENQDNMDSIFNIAREEIENYNTLTAIVVEDIVMIGRESVEKAVHLAIDCFKTPNKIILRYIVAKHFHTALVCTHSNDVLIEGCILGDNNHHAIMLNYPADQVHKVVLRNNILKMSVGPAVAVLPYQFDADYFNKNTMPELVIEGFLDVYNWKTMSEMGATFNIFDVKALDLGDFIKSEDLASAINNALADLMESPEMAHLFYTDSSGERYASMGIFVLGAMFEQDVSKIKLMDKNLTVLTMPLSNVSGGAGIIIDLINAFTSRQGMPINKNCYLVGYNFDKHEPEVKPGEAVPQNYELYQRLQAGAQEVTNGGGAEYEVC